MLPADRRMYRQLDRQSSSPPRRAFHLEAPTDMLDPLTHTDEPEMYGLRVQNRFGIEATAVIEHLHPHVVRFKKNPYVHFPGPRVVHRVVNRFSRHHETNVFNGPVELNRLPQS